MKKMEFPISKCSVINLSLAVFVGLLSGCTSKQALRHDQSMIDQLIEDNQEAIAQCYQKNISKNPKLPGGKITLRADHLPDGSLSRVRPLKSFVGAGPVIECMTDIIESWKTPRPYVRGPVDISWVFKKDTAS